MEKEYLLEKRCCEIEEALSTSGAQKENGFVKSQEDLSDAASTAASAIGSVSGPPPIKLKLAAISSCSKTLSKEQQCKVTKLKEMVRNIPLKSISDAKRKDKSYSIIELTRKQQLDSMARGSQEGQGRCCTVAELLWCTEQNILRYLKAYRDDVDLASAKLQETLLWRCAICPDEIEPERLMMLEPQIKCYRRGFDYEENALIYFRPALDASSMSAENTLLGVIYTIERAVQSLKMTKETSKLTVLVDMSDWTVTQMPSFDAMKAATHLLGDHYPNLLNCAYVMDAPETFLTLWNAIRWFLHPQTLEKITFLRSSKLQDVRILRRNIPLHNLDVKFGGNTTEEYIHKDYWREEIAQFIAYQENKKALVDILTGMAQIKSRLKAR